MTTNKKVLTAMEKKNLLRRYHWNEARNYHTENAVMLIKRFGTKADNQRAKMIKQKVKGQGHISKPQWDFYYKKGHSHYHKLLK